MKPRKIVQVAADEHFLTVLADDGSLWALGNGGGEWQQLPPLPPIEEPEGEEKV